MHTMVNEYRCDCGKLLFKGFVYGSHVDIKCGRCGKIVKIFGLADVDRDEGITGIIYDDQGRVVKSTAKALSMFGYSETEIKDLFIHDINTAFAGGFFQKILKFTKDTGNTYRFDTICRTKDGFTSPVAVLLRYFPVDRKDGMFAVYRLLSDLDNHTDVSHPLESVCDFVFDIDLHANTTYIGPEIKSICGCNESDVIGDRAFIFKNAVGGDEGFKKWQLFSSNQRPFNLKKHIIKCSNDKVWSIDAIFFPKFNDLGRFVGYNVLNWIEKDVNKED